MNRLFQFLALVPALLLPFGCATNPQPKPGTGDLAFRVRWSGAADVDLSVTSPLGEHVAFERPEAPSGGMHDVDCNYSSPVVEKAPPGGGVGRSTPGLPAVDRHDCRVPMENVFWPRGKAPAGLYRVLLYVANPNDTPAPSDAYRLEVIVRGDVRLVRTGLVSSLKSEALDLNVAFR